MRFTTCQRQPLSSQKSAMMSTLSSTYSLRPMTFCLVLVPTHKTAHGSTLRRMVSGVVLLSEPACFSVRVFNPHTPFNQHTQLSSCYRKHEQERKCACEQRVRKVEHATFIPLVMAATGGLANEANISTMD